MQDGDQRDILSMLSSWLNTNLLKITLPIIEMDGQNTFFITVTISFNTIVTNLSRDIFEVTKALSTILHNKA